MPEPAGLDKVYSAVAETARLLNVPCSPDQVSPAVKAFGDELPGAHIVFSMAAGEQHRGELDFDFSLTPKGLDPYATALANGLIEETDHPVGSLLAEIQARCAIASYGVEYGIVGGFKKSYAFFPLDDFPPLAKFAGIPSMPPGLAEHVDTLTSLGLDDKVSAIGINYAKRTLNVYLAVAAVRTETKLALLRAFGFAEPDASVAEFVKRSFSVYPTIGWDSSAVERICFSVKTQNPGELPAPFHPEIETFANGVPHAYEGGREFVSAVALAPSGQAYYKLAAYYQKAREASNAAFAATSN
ncbi:aromatic prenyltransferase [Streptomyces sp. NBC_01334]|uniref:aromatic prenyltransferase n=1 Tax=Streptomyces sp. NBC_01334 TaxID=2903827 RepID=UPI002E11ED74|nr:aromatic prenyltransferase [Streptomyces sp. NBC_01334]WSN45232.1 aromatic prenyltransferase [Streptomyces sp. NBC_01334]